MRVGVGYSDNPDSFAAGRDAAAAALAMAGRPAPCDLVLIFATATHDPAVLTAVVRHAVGPTAPIVGGGAVGAVTNHGLGYAGDQVGVALFWFDAAACAILSESGLDVDEHDAGRRLGRRLAELKVDAGTPILLFYDAIYRDRDHMRLLMATPLLAGIRESLGFLPPIAGAGLQGDYAGTPIRQWNGRSLASHEAVAVVFGGGVRMDTAVMHGCRPATGYYTVTRADRETILEIDGQPALSFLQSLLGPGLDPGDYPFFITFGINQGGEWDGFNEENYANRLCFSIDRERGGVVMFEPDMVESTRFQLMHRAIDLDYIEPKLQSLFDKLGQRVPVFAMYIDCAGRAAGYAGTDLEDAEAVRALTGGVPFLGIYSGVEIGPVRGKTRALDWTGVYCLFSVPHG